MTRIHDQAITKIETAKELYSFLMKNDTGAKVMFEYEGEFLVPSNRNDNFLREVKGKSISKAIIKLCAIDFDCNSYLAGGEVCSYTSDYLLKEIDNNFEEEDIINFIDEIYEDNFVLNFKESKIVFIGSLIGDTQETIYVFKLCEI